MVFYHLLSVHCTLSIAVHSLHTNIYLIPSVMLTSKLKMAASMWFAYAQWQLDESNASRSSDHWTGCKMETENQFRLAIDKVSFSVRSRANDKMFRRNVSWKIWFLHLCERMLMGLWCRYSILCVSWCRHNECARSRSYHISHHVRSHYLLALWLCFSSLSLSVSLSLDISDNAWLIEVVRFEWQFSGDYQPISQHE